MQLRDQARTMKADDPAAAAAALAVWRQSFDAAEKAVAVAAAGLAGADISDRAERRRLQLHVAVE